MHIYLDGRMEIYMYTQTHILRDVLKLTVISCMTYKMYVYITI